MEIRVPNFETETTIGAQRDLLDQHIAATNSKKSKVAKETVFLDITVHNQVDDVQAITLEFANERNYNTYLSVVQEFRDWAITNHNVEYVMEKTSITSYAALATELLDPTNGSTDTYYDNMKKHMVVDLPTSRGFK
jgi:hypothetical protein